MHRPLSASVSPFVRPFQPTPGKCPHLEKSLLLGPVRPNLTKSSVPPEAHRAAGMGKNPPSGGASIAFVWTWGKPLPRQPHLAGRSPHPLSERRTDEEGHYIQHPHIV